ncbi:MAG: DUF4124 domain-containing protein [Syntrophaceae bacterium]|nr:DUF4124 domain-containing protein [Syntrophaceae bacterium]
MCKRVLIIGWTMGFLMSSSFIHAEVFKWVDDKGTLHFTDDYSRIPSFYREQQQVEIKREVQEEKRSLEPMNIVIRMKEEQVEAGPYDQEEMGWREKERSWKDQFERALENEKLVEKKFIEESNQLILRKFGSHQQFKSTILRLDRIKEERALYEDQIIEAEGMLEKLSRGVKASKGEMSGWINTLIPLQTASSEIRKIEKDIYGRDEVWWRQKVFDARESLEKAIQNYERTYRTYRQDIERLNSSRFGGLSLTQYQMISLRLTAFNDQLKRDQSQIAEAMEVLKKLSKEAREAHADPAWLDWLD